jgi:excisionase family DNA binding protein
MADEKPLTTGDVARKLRVSESHVRDLERSGRLPALRTSTGIRLFQASDVEKLAAERLARTR